MRSRSPIISRLRPRNVGLFSMSCTLQSMRSRWSSRSPATSRIAVAHRGERTLGRRAALQRLAQQLEALGVVGEQRVFLGVEVAEEGAGRDVGRGGDLLDRDVLEAPLGGEAQRGVGDLLAGAELVALAQPEGRRACLGSRLRRVPACGTECHEYRRRVAQCDKRHAMPIWHTVPLPVESPVVGGPRTAPAGARSPQGAGTCRASSNDSDAGAPDTPGARSAPGSSRRRRRQARRRAPRATATTSRSRAPRASRRPTS